MVQETMIRMWNIREEWQAIDSLEAYSLRICRNLAIDRTKRMSAKSLSLDEQQNGHEKPDANITACPEQQAIIHDKLELVKKLIATLPEKQRCVIQLRDFEGKPYKQIAEILGITEDQVKVNLFRARQSIKQKYIATDNYGL